LGRNKGYGTREHYRALDALGPTAFHRKSFKLREEGALF
jgi:ribonuclease HII